MGKLWEKMTQMPWYCNNRFSYFSMVRYRHCAVHHQPVQEVRNWTDFCMALCCIFKPCGKSCLINWLRHMLNTEVPFILHSRETFFMIVITNVSSFYLFWVPQIKYLNLHKGEMTLRVDVHCGIGFEMAIPEFSSRTGAKQHCVRDYMVFISGIKKLPSEIKQNGNISDSLCKPPHRHYIPTESLAHYPWGHSVA